MKLLDRVLAWFIDRIPVILGSFWPPTGSIGDSYTWTDAYRSRGPDDTQNGQQP